jgi:hypothetical protein
VHTSSVHVIGDKFAVVVFDIRTMQTARFSEGEARAEIAPLKIFLSLIFDICRCGFYNSANNVTLSGFTQYQF